jgi:hypothetical protein
MEVICFSETSVHIQATRRYVPEDGSFHDYRCENLKSYKMNFDPYPPTVPCRKVRPPRHIFLCVCIYIKLNSSHREDYCECWALSDVEESGRGIF